MFWAEAEIVAQDAEVEQHLYIVFLDMKRTIAVARVALEEVVLSRFLLHKQLQVGCHEVDAPLDAQFLADETRFEDSFLLIISAKEFGNDRLHVAYL